MANDESSYWRLIRLYFMAVLIVPTSYVLYWVWWCLFPCTVYSKSYDEAAFRAIEVGQDMAEVQKSLGPPYRVVQPYTRRWEYDGWVVFFDEKDQVQVEQLYQWDATDIAEFMGHLPEGVRAEDLAGLSPGKMTMLYGSPKSVEENPWGNERMFFYTHPASGGMWADRTWKKRMLTVDMRTNCVTKKDAYWRVAGD